MERETYIARLLAPEDIRPGQFVAVLHVVDEYLPLGCLFGETWTPIEPLRVLWLPEPRGLPMKVLDVCLPFVLVKRPKGDCRTLDVRRQRLARVSTRFGRAAFERVKAARRKRKREKDDDKDDDGDDD
jgi:hypothetical protein